MFCENKDKPLMHCNGKCHMMKQLKDAEKKGQLPTSKNAKEKLSLSFCSEIKDMNFIVTSEISELYYSYHFSKSPPHLKSIFHPPTC